MPRPAILATAAILTVAAAVWWWRHVDLLPANDILIDRFKAIIASELHDGEASNWFEGAEAPRVTRRWATGAVVCGTTIDARSQRMVYQIIFNPARFGYTTVEMSTPNNPTGAGRMYCD